ncbi:MAG: hypothetical protein D6737_12700 [Chloroflexi bacterium]|nr:MAG: hypothetical protein D6737_12700 [Chloroflexota bacterium]
MTTIDTPRQKLSRETPQRITTHPISSLRYDLIMALLATVFTFGVFTDGFAHNHGAIDETFFTPWHIGMYGSYFSIALLLAMTIYRNVAHGYAFSVALPRGYTLSLIGVLLFTLAGTLDIVWHNFFGFEEDLEALLSPTHLVLASGGTLFISGPFRAMWSRPRESLARGWRGHLPIVLSLFTLYALTSFMTQFANPFFGPDFLTGRPEFAAEYYAQRYFHDATGVSYILIPTALMMGYILLAIRRWHTLPFGSLTLILTGSAFLSFTLRINNVVLRHWPILLAAFIGGLIADVLLRWLKPSESLTRFRIFAAVLPHLFFSAYFIALLLTDGLWWRVHLWAGLPFLAGAVGLGISLLLAPPSIPENDT